MIHDETKSARTWASRQSLYTCSNYCGLTKRHKAVETRMQVEGVKTSQNQKRTQKSDEKWLTYGLISELMKRTEESGCVWEIYPKKEGVRSMTCLTICNQSESPVSG